MRRNIIFTLLIDCFWFASLWVPNRISAGQTISNSHLVDPASSHMLVSKIKPCLSKNKPLNGESANGSLNQLLFI